MGGDDDGCARSDWSGVTKLPQEALLWRDASDRSAIDLSAIDLSARLGGSSDFSVAERDLGAPSLSIATKTCPQMSLPGPGCKDASCELAGNLS